MRVVLAVVIASFAGGPARAQTGGAGVALDLGTLLRSPVGAWAEYTLEEKGDPEVAKVRYALVEKTDARLAIEVTMRAHARPFLMRVEYASANGIWRESSAKLVVGGNTVSPAPIRFGPTPTLRGAREIGMFVRQEAVVVPGGRFDCACYQATISEPGTRTDRDTRKADVWMSDRAQPTGLVKARVPSRGLVILLSATGEGARPTANGQRPDQLPTLSSSPCRTGKKLCSAQPGRHWLLENRTRQTVKSRLLGWSRIVA